MIKMKKIVVVIPSFNNSKWYKKNLNSVVSQNYSNYRTIYIDDLSPDGTGKLVEDYVNSNNLQDKITVIKNKKRLGAMHNLYNVIHSCDDDEIIVTLDGDDWFANTEALSKVASIYSDENVWMTYGSYQDHPGMTRGCCRPYEQNIINANSFRRAQWRASHLRTFCVKLFKKIKKEDFYDRQGKWLDMAWDLAFMLPMLEMSGNHHKYINDILYSYNNENPISDFRLNVGRQGALDRFIRSKPRYNRLSSL